MPVFAHDILPLHEVPRIKTRVLVNGASGSEATAVWEQWIHPDGYIPEHYHDVEEVLVILAGVVDLRLADTLYVTTAPATVLVPARQLHSMRPSGDADVHLLAIFPVAQPKIYAPDGSPRPLPWDDTSG